VKTRPIRIKPIGWTFFVRASDETGAQPNPYPLITIEEAQRLAAEAGARLPSKGDLNPPVQEGPEAFVT